MRERGRKGCKERESKRGREGEREGVREREREREGEKERERERERSRAEKEIELRSWIATCVAQSFLHNSSNCTCTFPFSHEPT